MSTALKLLLLPALVVAFSVGVALAASTGSDGGDPAPLPASGTTTLDTGPTEIGTTTLETGTTPVGDGIDISGPCDEAEHANDPRCTGDAPAGSSGPGPGRGDDGHDDRSGPSGPDNSGPGSLSSGHGDGDGHDEDGR